ncbi:MAG: YkgJ family cysteine cluster protein [Proteobacteria bacterium]|nr:YkgJ family cysteine cluster protein [Desulfobacula sp.]MBU3953096.1 YkgJ family cysteine cluster protein [Pseudomonadota bacterium]MBU4132926.1 YkgJ family cysteine cluster protein [Pseudomonadota bacterium]
MVVNLTDFQCIRCHACCREPGYVRLTKDEPDAVALFLNLDVHAFIHRFTRLTQDRTALSLKEKEDGSCIFLGDTGCSIHPVKPLQCRQFPHVWKFADFETICGWARKKEPHNPRILNPSSNSK